MAFSDICEAVSFPPGSRRSSLLSFESIAVCDLPTDEVPRAIRLYRTGGGAVGRFQLKFIP
jgi:hypothetical protein